MSNIITISRKVCEENFCQAFGLAIGRWFPKRYRFSRYTTVVSISVSRKKCKREEWRWEKKSGNGKEVRGREGRTLPSCDQHRHGIASNLWVRLITGECRSSDSSLLLRPHLSTRPVFRDESERGELLLSPPSSFVHPFLPFPFLFSPFSRPFFHPLTRACVLNVNLRGRVVARRRRFARLYHNRSC